MHDTTRSHRHLNIKLLHIDESPTERQAVWEALPKEGYEIMSAASLHDGLEKLHAHSPDLLVIDQHFQDGTGLQFVHTLRTSPDFMVFSRLPVILLCAPLTHEEAVQAALLMAHNIVKKPWCPDALLSAVDDVFYASAGGGFIGSRNLLH